MADTKYGIYDPKFNTWICNRQFEIYIFGTAKEAEAQIKMFRLRDITDHTTPDAVNRYIAKPYEEE